MNTEQIEAEELINDFIYVIGEHDASTARDKFPGQAYKTAIKLALIHCDKMIELLNNVCSHESVWVGDDKSAESLDDTISHYQSIKRELNRRL